MFTQLTWRSHPESRPPTGDNICRQRVHLSAVSLLLIVAPFVESQERPAKQGPGRVKLIDTVTGNKEFITLLAFTNGGKTLVSLSNDYGDKPRGLEIKSWDVATRKVTATISQAEPAYGCALSPDGNTLAVGLYAPRGHPTSIRVFDLSQKTKPKDIKVDDSSFMRAVAFSSDGKVLAWVVSPLEVGSPVAKKIRLWNIPAGKLIGTLTAKADVGSLAFNPGGKSLASWSAINTVNYDNPVSLWDVGIGNETKTFEIGKGKTVQTMVFTPDGKNLAIGAFDPAGKAGSEVKLWEMATGKNSKTLPDAGAPFAFTKDGKVLAAGNQFKLWNAATGKELITLALHDGGVRCAAFSPDGRTLVTGGADKTIMWWKLPANAHTYPRLELQMGIPDESRPR